MFNYFITYLVVTHDPIIVVFLSIDVPADDLLVSIGTILLYQLKVSFGG